MITAHKLPNSLPHSHPHSFHLLPLVAALSAMFALQAHAQVNVAAGDTLATSGSTVTVVVPTGTSSITNAGTISQTGTGRTVDANTGTPVLTINNLAGGVMSAATAEVIRLNRAAGTYTINNQGTIWATSTTPGGSRAIKADAAYTSTNNQIVNGAADNRAAVIRSDANDAIRLGTNFTLTNYGSIFSTGVVNTSCPDYLGAQCVADLSAADGVAIENGRANVVILNHGSITGPRHGIDGGDPVAATAASGLIGVDRLVVTSTGPNGVTFDSVSGGVTTSGVRIANPVVINYADGVIRGNNGSGVGLDGHGVVINYGSITGAYAGAGNAFNHEGLNLTTSNGDGDGVDIDGIAYIENHGSIRGLGAGGLDSGGSPNGADGIAAGGGTIVNGAGALIYGQSKGILIDDGSAGTALPAQRGTTGATGGVVSITNDGTITGERGAAIGLVGNFDDRLVNGASGVITGGAQAVRVDETTSTTPAAAVQMGAGNDTLTNHGRIEGRNGLAIDMGAGDDVARLMAGGSTGVVLGSVDGGDGVDTLETGGTQNFASGAVLRFERFIVRDGFTTFNDALGNVTSVQVDAGAALRINGAFSTSGDLTVNGELKAPASTGVRTTAVGGNYAQGAAGVLEARLGAGNASDRLAVTGSASFANGATLRPLPQDYVADGTVYTLVSAGGGLSAVPAQLRLDTSAALVGYTLSVSGNDLLLTARRNSTIAATAPAGLGGVGGALDALGQAGGSSAGALLGALDTLPDAQAVADALKQMSPDTSGASQQLAQMNSNAVFSAFSGRMDQARTGGNLAQGGRPTGLSSGDDIGRRGWVQGLGAWGEQKPRAGASGYALDAYGVAAGLEVDRAAREVMGVSVALNRAEANGRGAGLGDDVRINAATLGGYWSRNTDGMTLDAAVLLGRNSYDSRRSVNVGGITQTLRGDYNGWQIGGQVEAGFPFAAGMGVEGRWLVGGRAAYLATGGYTEQGGSAALRMGSSHASSLQSVLGVEINRAVSPRSTVQLQARYLHEFAGSQDLRAAFVAGGPAFTVAGAEAGRDALQLGLGLRHEAARGVAVTLRYDAEIRRQYLTHQLSARASWAF